MVVGVPARELGSVFARALQEGGVQRAIVVCGHEGLDEISCAGGTWVWDVRPEIPIVESTIHPEDFGLPTHSLASVKGGSAADNALILQKMLTSGEKIPQKFSPILDFILLNASAVLVVAGLASDFREGVRLARESVTSGRAWDALLKFREVDQMNANVSS